TFLRSWMKRCASAPRSSGKASATTGWSFPPWTHSVSGSMNSSSDPFESHRVSMFRPITDFETGIIRSGLNQGVPIRVRPAARRCGARSGADPVADHDELLQLRVPLREGGGQCVALTQQLQARRRLLANEQH